MCFINYGNVAQCLLTFVVLEKGGIAIKFLENLFKKKQNICDSKINRSVNNDASAGVKSMMTLIFATLE